MTPADFPSILLAIETTGSACSAVVMRDGAPLAAEQRDLRHGHAEALMPLIDRVVTAAGIVPSQLEAIAASIGPGSFTGIRVGLAAARGIALAAGARLIGVTTFAAVAAAVPSAGGESTLLVALDSRREDFYVQLFAPTAVEPLIEPAAILPDQLYEHIARPTGGRPLRIAGDAAAAAAAALEGRLALALLPDITADAFGVAAAAMRQLRSGQPPPRARPLYLRPPDVTMPKLRHASPRSAA